MINNDSINSDLDNIRTIINDSTSVLVYYDTDADGLTSYIQVKKYFGKKIKGIPYFYKDSVKKIHFDNKFDKTRFDTIVFLDIPEIEEDDILEGKKIIWMDHHPSKNQDLITKHNITYFNPLEYNETNYAVCYWSYLLTEKKNINLALIGTVSDFFIIEELFNNATIVTKNKFDKISKSGNKNKEQLTTEDLIRELTYNSSLTKYIQFFNYVFKLKDYEIDETIRWLEQNEVYDVIIEIESEKNTFVEKVMLSINKINDLLKDALKQPDEKLFIFEYSNRISYTSILANMLGYHLKNWKIIFIIFVSTKDNRVSFSLRSRKEVIINGIVSSISKKYNGKGGGHPNACGASVDLQYKEEYMNDIIKEFSLLINNE